MHSSLGDDIGIESVAEVNGVNIITVTICDQFSSHQMF